MSDVAARFPPMTGDASHLQLIELTSCWWIRSSELERLGKSSPALLFRYHQVPLAIVVMPGEGGLIHSSRDIDDVFEWIGLGQFSNRVDSIEPVNRD